jgi:hypothetical protein
LFISPFPNPRENPVGRRTENLIGFLFFNCRKAILHVEPSQALSFNMKLTFLEKRGKKIKKENALKH